MQATARPSVEEELSLIRRAQEGDARALQRLTTAHLGLVRKVAARYRGFAPLADLVQEGSLGLLHAVRKFDADRGVRLSTYAVWWIRATILRYLEHNTGLVRLTTTRARTRLFYHLARTRQQLAAAGVEPTAQDVADVLDVPVEEVARMEQGLRPGVSLDAPVGDEAGRDRAVDRLADDDEGPGARLEERELGEVLRGRLAEFAAHLSGRELEVFRDRIASDAPVSLQALGERWGVTREAARRLEHKVLVPLRRYLQRELGDALPPPPPRQPNLSAYSR